MTNGVVYWASMSDASSPGMVEVSLVSRARRTLGELYGVAIFDMLDRPGSALSQKGMLLV